MAAMRTLSKLLVLALLVQIGACTESGHPELRGSLYFAAGNYLATLDLRDGGTAIAANLGDVDIHSMSPQLTKRLLLSIVGSKDNRETHKLVLYDLATRQTLTLLDGRDGHYLPGTMTLVYDDGVRIYVTERVAGHWEKTEVAAHRYNQRVDILPLSGTRFIYRIGDGPLLLYDKTANRTSELTGFESACRFERALWFADREQMLCQTGRDEQAFDYAFIGLDGTVHDRVPLPPTHDLRPLAYLPDQDVVILTERWRSRLASRAQWGVWVYDLGSQEAWRLLDDQHLGTSVLYVPD